jgi:hypothetical protein
MAIRREAVHRIPKSCEIENLQEWWVTGGDYSKLSHNDIVNLADEVDFTIWKIENKFRTLYFLRDEQQANLGGIEEECFKSMIEVAKRLEMYYIDYLGEQDE